MSKAASPAGRSLEDETRLWFQTIWPNGVPEDAQLLAWTLPRKISRFLAKATASRLAALARELTPGNETYIGTCALALGALLDTENGRGTKKDLAYAPALTVDLDLASGPGRKKPGLFQSRDEIFDLIARLPLAPSLVVWSGHGVQLWWVLREIYVLGEGGLYAFEKLSRGWTRYVASIAKTMERTVDPAWDSTRVLRLPGTMNRKDPVHPIEVRILEANEHAYNESDFQEYIVEGDDRAYEATGGGWEEIAARIVVLAGAKVDALKLDALRDAIPKADAAWKRKRTDMPDQSTSGYAMALADYAVQAGWSDQEIVDLIIAWREKHGELFESSHNRYARTIFKARHPTVGVMPEQEPAAASTPPPAGPAAEDDAPRSDDPTMRAQSFETVRKRSGISLAKVIQSSDGDTFSIVTADGREKTIGSTKEMYRWRRWQEIATELRIMPPPEPTRAIWDTVVRNLIPFIEQADDDFSKETLFSAALAEYAGTAQTLDGATLKEKEPTIKSRQPFIEGGKLFLNSAHFVGWLARRSDRLERPEVIRLLKRLGFKSDNAGTGKVTKKYWRAPLSALGEEEEAT